MMLLQGELIMGSNIYIRTKNRVDCSVPKALDKEGIFHYLVVEPQDYAQYAAVKLPTTTLLTLDRNDGGYDVVRHFIMSEIKKSGKPGWMFDDDILSIAEVRPIPHGKMPRTLFKSTYSEAIPAMERDFHNAVVALGAPVTQTWCCHSNVTGLNFRKSEYHMVYMDPNLLPSGVFTEKLPWRLEDATLAARVALEGQKIACHNDWAIGFTPCGVNLKGGAADLYGNKEVFDKGVQLVHEYYESLLSEYLPKLRPDLREKFGNKKLYRMGMAKAKQRKHIYDIWANHSNIAKLSEYLRESGAYDE